MITASTFLSVAIFCGIILILVLMLNFAESKLLPQGEVTININGDDEKSMQLKPGPTLLSALATQNIFLPSACGGGGTCALCKCQVNEGGGEILPSKVLMGPFSILSKHCLIIDTLSFISSILQRYRS